MTPVRKHVWETLSLYALRTQPLSSALPLRPSAGCRKVLCQAQWQQHADREADQRRRARDEGLQCTWSNERQTRATSWSLGASWSLPSLPLFLQKSSCHRSLAPSAGSAARQFCKIDEFKSARIRAFEAAEKDWTSGPQGWKGIRKVFNRYDPIGMHFHENVFTILIHLKQGFQTGAAKL